MTDCKAITLLLTNNHRWGEEYPSRVRPLTLINVTRSGELADEFCYLLIQVSTGAVSLPGEHGHRDPRGPAPSQPTTMDPCRQPKKGMVRVTIQHLPNSPKQKEVIYL